MISVVIAHRFAVVRAGVRSFLEEDSDFAVVGEASEGRGALRLCGERRPTVLLVDVELRDTPLPQLVTTLRSDAATTSILGIATRCSHWVVKRCDGLAIQGCLSLETDTAASVREAIHTMLGGGKWFARVADGESEGVRLRKLLTPREIDVLKSLALGLTNAQIAQVLTLSKTTVENHVATIYRKLNLPNRNSALLFAIRNGLVPVHPLEFGGDNLRDRDGRDSTL